MLNHSSPSPDAASRHLRSLIGKTLAYFAQREVQNLALIRAHLANLLDARPAPARAQNLRSASMLLYKEAEAFNRTFQRTLQRALEDEAYLVLPQASRASFGPRLPVDPLNGLSLIDVREMERILLLDRVAQRFTAHYDGSVSPLTLRLGRLLGRDAPSLSSNPFRPEVWVRAFLRAWEQAGLDDQATEDLVQALDPRHTIDLAPLYADLDATLMQAGVLAQPQHRIKKSEGLDSLRASSFGKQEVTTDTRSDRERSAWAGAAPAGRGMAAQARQFLQRLGLGLPLAASGAAAGTVAHADLAVADAEFMGYLGDLQAGAASSDPLLKGQDPADHNILRQMRDRDEVRRAPELDRGTVDALAEVFDFVFADQAIPVQMKYVIGRLQIPVLKAAMMDRDFFLCEEHPARRLVDTLAQASIAWAPEKGEGDPLYQRIENTVKRVLIEFEDDIALFADLLQEFTQFLFETEQQVQGRIEPAAQHELVGESFEQALAHADEVIHAHIQALSPGQPLASFLVPFLTGQWRQVMARAWLEGAAHPAQWASVLSTLEQLIWSTQPKTRTEDRRQLVAVLPELVRNLNAGLDAIDWGAEPRATFTRRLISTHMMAIRLTQPTQLETVSGALEASAGQEALQALDERRAGQLAASTDAFDQMAQSFTRGMWFDFVVNQTTQHRCRLSWVSPMRTRLLFTNRDGFDAFVRSEREVAALLRHDQLRVVDQLPIVSRALDRLMADAGPQGAA